MKKAVLLALLLAGCQTTEERLAQEDALCQSYGAKPGSSDYMQCRMMKDQQYNANSARRAAASQKSLSDMQTNIRVPDAGPIIGAPSHSSRCITRQTGPELITDCN